MNFITIKEAQKKYLVSAVTLRRWLKSGKIKGQRIGLKWLVEDAEHERNADVYRNLFDKSLREFLYECVTTAGYIDLHDGNGLYTTEFASDRLGPVVDKYTNLLLKFIIWRGGEK